MLEQEFENTKQFLLSKLPEYLMGKGINLETSFKCLNPSDTSRMPSMTYNRENLTVQCFNCKSIYNIFDIIGFDYHLTSYLQQFIKVHEMYIGKVPLGFIDLLKNKEIQLHSNEVVEEKPLFEIERNNEPEPLLFGQAPSLNMSANDNIPAKHTTEERFFNNVSPFDEQPLPPFGSTSANVPQTKPQAFGSNFGQQNISQENDIPKFGQKFSFEDRATNQVAFAESQVKTMHILNSESGYDFTNYINGCASNVSRTSYFKDRGLSDAIIQKFKLGFDAEYQAEIDNLTGQSVYWKAAIIPYGTQGYCVRNTDLSADSKTERYKKKGSFDIYNHAALEKQGPIFIAEGEFDALSLETLGYNALALGGVGNVRLLVERIKNAPNKNEFYICLDNDEAGKEATEHLASYLRQLNIQFKCVDLAYPYKDINEALYRDKDTLRERLTNLDQILSYKFNDLYVKAKNYKFIGNAEDLASLNLSDTLYSFTGKPILLRFFVAQIIRAKSCSVIYAGSNTQCRNLSQAVLYKEMNYDKNNWQLIKLLSVNEESMIQKVCEGIDSLVIKDNRNFVVILDLTSYTNLDALAILEQVSNKVDLFNVPVIALTNEQIADSAQALSLQNIVVTHHENGDFKCVTNSNTGNEISFMVYKQN